MDRNDLVLHYPTLYHMACAGSWPAIHRHGLWSTEQIVTSSQGAFASEVLSEHRPRSVTADHPTLGTVTIRDQAPLRRQFLEECLTDMSPAQWLSALNDRVFFWLHPRKLDRLLGAKRYRNFEQDVLVVDTRSLLDAHYDHVRLSPMNSGATLYPNAPARGSDTFATVEDYPYATRRRGRVISEAITELAVIGGVHDIADHVLRVERRRGADVLETY